MKRVAVLFVLVVLVAACKQKEKPVTATAYGHGASKESQTQTEPQEARQTGIEVGATMPEYAALNLDGSKFDLAQHRDKVVLVNVWATWCGPCVFEIPELQKMHDQYGPRGFEVIGVSVDESGAESVKAFVDEHKMTYPIALDAEGKLATLLQTTVLPTSVLVDRKGTIVWKQKGLIDESDQGLKAAIEKAL